MFQQCCLKQQDITHISTTGTYLPPLRRNDDLAFSSLTLNVGENSKERAST
jgi:hypothetical protein